MKTLNKFHSTILATAFVAALAFTVTSCKKSSTTTSDTVTEADAAQVTVDAVTPSTGGIVSQFNTSAAIFTGADITGGTVSSVNNHLTSYATTIPCGTTKDSTIAYASTGTSIPSFTYSLDWKYTLTCTAPSNFALNFNGAGSYNGLVLSSTFNSTGGFVLTGLGATVTQFTYNSNYTRTGTTTSKVGNKNTFNHALTITSTNIIYDKATQEIVSGTAAVSIKVTSTSGNSWSYGGTLTFLGNKTGKLVLNSGVVYNISWS